MAVIGLLHPGEMGAAIGAALRANGHEVLWASAGRSDATRRRANQAGLVDAGSVAAVAQAAAVILSVCPPHAALATARPLHSYAGTYVDANAISAATARTVAAAVANPVDGGIVGPPPTEPGTTRLYLSGAGAEPVAALFAGTPLEAPVVSDQIGAASALKMAYAGWTKGTAALLLGVRALARAEGVEDALLSEWERSQPQLAKRSDGAAGSALAKGWRWQAEMQEIAASFAAAGLPDGFHRAAAEIFARTPHGHAEDSQPLEQVLAALLDQAR